MILRIILNANRLLDHLNSQRLAGQRRMVADVRQPTPAYVGVISVDPIAIALATDAVISLVQTSIDEREAVVKCAIDENIANAKNTA